ncbi:hypothetical protein [Klebsiella grimontii]|jgi:hypothetical protein|uniref:hypothetical protein n=1 Tax=Klebsiella grimontii TaxID=2058152 RepID=UPI000462D7FD|nr:hypothetical protein [Klebsiella grimontii]TCZ59084.1 hypothetical protein E0D83_13255 [Klebsiella grimontii]
MDKCRLCGRETVLELSHILPKFIFKYAKSTSLTGHIRATENPNRIVQDGKKIPFLCKECETLFSGWESYFSQNIFHPYQNDEKDSFDYDYRLSKFLASVSFRVLLYSFENDKNDFFDSTILKHAPVAINNLKEYLLGNNPHPKEQRQSLVLLDKTSDEINDKNMYLTRAIDFDVMTTDDCSFVYIKYLKFLQLCPIKLKTNRGWRTARISNATGTLCMKDQELPDYVLMKMNQSIKLIKSQRGELSSNQKDKIEERIINSVIDQFN